MKSNKSITGLEPANFTLWFTYTTYFSPIPVVISVNLVFISWLYALNYMMIHLMWPPLSKVGARALASAA